MPTELCELLLSEKCDLLVFEGMGRAIHTNFAAQFTIGTDINYNYKDDF